ncbi:MAG: cation:proton antiporter [Candidatus Aenigmarchaeota archaeon]|nr:cation:proton antiporter [Candidatus Aenigmarchaeota archaeon]
MIPYEFFLMSGFLAVLVITSVLRAFLGRTSPDRLVAADTINTLTVAILVLLGAAYENIMYIDVAIVYAMLSFVTTLFVSKHLEGGK